MVTERRWVIVVRVGWSYEMKGSNNKSAQRNFWVWYSCYFLVWLWFHGYIQSQNLSTYILNMRSLLYANHTLIKLLRTEITFTNRFTAFLLCRALCWDTILGWNVFLWWMYTLGYQSPFLIFMFSHSKPYPHSTRHIHLSLNPKNDSGIAIIWIPIFPRNWVFHSL